MRITRLEAKGIGPFEDLNIEFKPKPAGMENKSEIHILTGENGTGKSTILMMLASCADRENDQSIRNRVHKWHPYHGIPSYVTESHCEVSFDFHKSFSNFDLEPYEKYKDFNYSFKNKKIYHDQYSKKKFNTIENQQIQYAFFGYSGYRSASGDGLINIEEIIVNPFEKAVSFSKTIDSKLVLKWVANLKTKELIVKGKGNNADIFSNAVDSLEKALSSITGKKMEFELEESLRVSVKIDGKNLSFDILPDGLKSIISWLSDLLMRLDRIDWADKTRSILEQNFILFLDEIEVHLHPSWQRKILPVVQDLFPNAQIFISTHSPFVVGSVDGARVYKFKIDENNNSVLDSEYLTEDGNSYDRILEEIFDIKERFGVGVQKQLEEFKDYKNRILIGEPFDNEAFGQLVNDLSNQSIELSNLMGFEIRQIERITKKSLETV